MSFFAIFLSRDIFPSIFSGENDFRSNPEIRRPPTSLDRPNPGAIFCSVMPIFGAGDLNSPNDGRVIVVTGGRDSNDEALAGAGAETLMPPPPRAPDVNDSFPISERSILRPDSTYL